ncbi:lysophospholipid acyltransferase family protein [Corynebacterium pacaense]|uniref:lysophospholipid acyltransferase family protein n=1 Tax=Corynebacterium pacaense TaxID=1816684 RepID=UPI0015C47725|nr:lysophospholipid acyltransferase family protein [Corynebacterium pacaense]
MPSSSTVVYYVSRFIVIGPALRVFGRPRFQGLDLVPRTGPVILAANHLAVVDSFYLIMAARREVKFLAKSDYFTGTGLKGRLQRWFFTSAGQIPVDRSGGDAATGSLDAAIELLGSGQAWGIHPEGTRSPDGNMHKGRTGVIRVALATGAPILPVAITGTEPRPGWRKILPRRVTVTVLSPFDLSGVDPDDRDSVRAATDALMREIAAVTGQKYVDTYARRWNAEGPGGSEGSPSA